MLNGFASSATCMGLLTNESVRSPPQVPLDSLVATVEHDHFPQPAHLEGDGVDGR